MSIPAVDAFTATRLNIRMRDLTDDQQRYERAVPPLPTAGAGATVAHALPSALTEQ